MPHDVLQVLSSGKIMMYVLNATGKKIYSFRSINIDNKPQKLVQFKTFSSHYSFSHLILQHFTNPLNTHHASGKGGFNIIYYIDLSHSTMKCSVLIGQKMFIYSFSKRHSLKRQAESEGLTVYTHSNLNDNRTYFVLEMFNRIQRKENLINSTVKCIGLKFINNSNRWKIALI